MQKLVHDAEKGLKYLRESAEGKNNIVPEAVPTLKIRDIETLEDRFQQWVSNIGALQPAASSLSLNHRLSNAPITKKAISGLLTDLAASANLASDIASAKRPNRVAKLDTEDVDTDDYELSSSDSATSTSSTSSLAYGGNGTINELQQLMASIKGSLANLFKASTLINRFSVNSRRQRARNHDPYPCDFDAGFIRNTFPLLGRSGTPEAEALILRLAEANARRRQFFGYCRNYHTRLSQLEEDRSSEADSNTQKDANPAATVAKTEATHLPCDPMATNPSNRSETRSVASRTSLSPSVFKADQEELLYPELPDEAAAGDGFICQFCMTSTVLRADDTQKRWHEHVIADLEPYVCTFLTCNLETFASSTAWFKHELLHHRKVWLCPSCDAQESSRQDLAKHLANSHQPIRSGELVDLLAGAARPMREIDATLCPFCNEALTSTNSTTKGKQSNRTVSVEVFQRHLAQHLRRIALFALPRPDTEDSPPGSSRGRSGKNANRSRDTMFVHAGESNAKFHCVYAVIDPEGTEKLRGSRFSSCLNGFKDVNRLREHIWRLHSPTHTCRYCRKRTTKSTEQFRQEHSACSARTDIKLLGPYPTLISESQVAALKDLNGHFNKPNDELSRCRKLWNALFPEREFPQELMIRYEPRRHQSPALDQSSAEAAADVTVYAAGAADEHKEADENEPTAEGERLSRSGQLSPEALEALGRPYNVLHDWIFGTASEEVHMHSLGANLEEDRNVDVVGVWSDTIGVKAPGFLSDAE